jgi:DNA-binding transcriptional MerR regulator
VSRAVNVSATTIKYYLSHLPRLIEFEGSGRKRRFSDRAVQMLSDVRRMLSDENKSLNQIRHELEKGGHHAGGTHHAHAAEAAPARKESSNGGRAAKTHHASSGGGSLEELMGALIHEVRGMRSDLEKLRHTRWVPQH